MTVNVALLESTMRYIEDHPEQHDQSVWVNECGTAGCFAGWACLLSGWQVGPRWDWIGPLMSPDTLIERYAPEIAVDLLGIEVCDASRLFDARNTRPMLALMVKDLANGEHLRKCDEYRDEASA